MGRLAGSLGLTLALLICSCQPLPPGRVDAMRAAVPKPPRLGHVYLLRGWQDLYSEGIDQLASELRARGVDAQAFAEEQWMEIASALVERSTLPGIREPLVLIGFSFGADDALRISQELAKRRVSVDLVVTIDPCNPPPVPGNVRACYNLYQTNGLWDLLPWLRGVPLNSQRRSGLVNVDLRRRRADLLEPGTAHSNIAGNPKIHDVVIRKVLEVCALRKGGA